MSPRWSWLLIPVCYCVRGQISLWGWVVFYSEESWLLWRLDGITLARGKITDIAWALALLIGRCWSIRCNWWMSRIFELLTFRGFLVYRGRSLLDNDTFLDLTLHFFIEVKDHLVIILFQLFEFGLALLIKLSRVTKCSFPWFNILKSYPWSDNYRTN